MHRHGPPHHPVHAPAHAPSPPSTDDTDVGWNGRPGPAPRPASQGGSR